MRVFMCKRLFDFFLLLPIWVSTHFLVTDVRYFMEIEIKIRNGSGRKTLKNKCDLILSSQARIGLQKYR